MISGNLNFRNKRTLIGAMLMLIVIGAFFIVPTIKGYFDFKNFYHKELVGVIKDRKQERGWYYFKVNGEEFIDLYAENSNALKVGDSIYKGKEQDFIELYRSGRFVENIPLSDRAPGSRLIIK